MMKNIIIGVIGIFVIIFFVIIFAILMGNGGIGPGLSDYEYDVANGYIVSRNSTHQIEIIPQNGYQSENEIIPEKVIEVAWNNRYIVAKQIGLKRAYPNDPNNMYEIPDESIVNYWILDSENRVRYGPFSYEKFILKTQEFNILYLKLKPVEEYI